MGMSEKLKKLVVKEETISINGDDYVIKGLTFKELSKLASYQDSKDYEGAMRYLLFVTLRKSDNETPDEELYSIIDSLDGEVGFKIVSKVQELTGIGGKPKN